MNTPGLFEIVILLAIPASLVFLILYLKEKNANKEMDVINEDVVETSFFSVRGRINRKTYLIRFMILFCFFFPFYLIEYDGAASFITNVGMLSCLILLFIQSIKRLHDLNLGIVASFFLLLPIVNFFFHPYIFFKAGTDGPNKYGAVPD